MIREHFVPMIRKKDKRTNDNHNDNNISELLLMDDNTFLSCSGDKTIKLWKYYNYQLPKI